MPAPAETYPALKRYRLELPADALVYEQGTVPAFFYMLLSGRVVFEVVDALGTRSVVDEVQPGGLLGVVSAFSGRPTSAAARTAARTLLLAVPVSAAAEVFRLAPEFAVAIVRQFANQPRAARALAAPTDPDEIAVEMESPPSLQLVPATAEGAPATVSAAVGTKRLDGTFNEQWFFKDEVQCPACRQGFSYLRVRASAVRPATRDSDFRIVYKTVDPSLYAVAVCPHCAYASYVEDFTELTANERRAIANMQAARMALVSKNLCGERDLDDAMLTLDLAQMCADARRAGLRRRAGLLHRRAWIERSRGNTEAERALIEQTRDAYLAVYEQDPDIQDTSAMRVAYLIGDLMLRLGDVANARRWLLECTRMQVADRQEGLVRMARMRLEDAKAALADDLPRSA